MSGFRSLGRAQQINEAKYRMYYIAMCSFISSMAVVATFKLEERPLSSARQPAIQYICNTVRERNDKPIN
jgi:hypothetical protein